MKISSARATGFLRGLPPEIVGVLLYGPDQGLVSERGEALVRSVAGTAADPFRVVELTTAAIRADPARLADEVGALALGGGRRVVWIRDAGDTLVPALDDILATSAGPALVVAEAAELSPRSALRRLFEGTASAAAVACYADEGHGLHEVIRTTLSDHGLDVSADAMRYLAGNLGADRMVTRRELEKLVLYMGGGGRVTVDDAMACIGDNAASSLDAVVFAAAGGDTVGLDRALARAFDEGATAVAVLRAAARHLQRLHMAAARVAAGQTPDQAMKALKPPVFFKFIDGFRAQMRAWTVDRLGHALDRVLRAELDCKTTGLPDRAICGRALMGIAQTVSRR